MNRILIDVLVIHSCSFLVFVLSLSNRDHFYLKVSELERNSSRILSRKRRYIAFPEGASISASLCTTIGAIGNPNVDFLSYALNWGVAYDLPNTTWVKHASKGFPKGDSKSTTTSEMYKAEVQRRHRRDLYNKIETAIDSMGFNGRDCILRTLCESSQYFSPNRKGNMIEELMRTIFSFPKQNVLSREHRDIHVYDRAYRKGRNVNDCSSLYPECTFSLLELAFGKYSVPEELSTPGFM